MSNSFWTKLIDTVHGGDNAWKAVGSVVALAFVVSMAAKKKNAPRTPAPPPPTTTTHSGTTTDQKVCVVGAGTIGSSFAAVFLARGMTVVSYDPYVPLDQLQHRIREYWMVLKARGIATTAEPPLDRLTQIASISRAVKGVDFVQECTWEDVDNKQKVLRELDELVDPAIIISSSTSFMPWDLLSMKCNKSTRHRILIGHPAIPHTHSFLEIYASDPAWAQHGRTWYTKHGGFDVIVMKKTIPGHVLNSMLKTCLDHGVSLVRQGVCSPEDVNTAARHLGRDMYARNAFLSLFAMIGGDRGVDGGAELSKRITQDAVFLILFSKFHGKGVPSIVARPLCKHLGHAITTLLLPGMPPEEYMVAAREYEDIITEGGKVPVQIGYFRATESMFQNMPLEVHNDPMKLQQKK